MKNNVKGYNELTSKMEATAKNELDARVNALSKKGRTAFQERCAAYYTS